MMSITCALSIAYVPATNFAAQTTLGPRAPPTIASAKQASFAVTALPARAPPVVASAKLLPAANVGLGAALLQRAAHASGDSRAVLASTGLLCLLNLAVTDNARYAGAKRAVAMLDGVPASEMGLAKRWYDCVKVQVVGQLCGLVWMVRSRSAAGALRGAATFMAANVLFFLLGAAEAKHDVDGRPAPIKASVARFVLITDGVLLSGALLGALCGAGSVGRAVGSYVFAAGCLIGAAEGAPKTIAAVRKLASR